MKNFLISLSPAGQNPGPEAPSAAGLRPNSTKLQNFTIPDSSHTKKIDREQHFGPEQNKNLATAAEKKIWSKKTFFSNLVHNSSSRWKRIRG